MKFSLPSCTSMPTQPEGTSEGIKPAPRRPSQKPLKHLSTDTTLGCQRPSRSTNMAPATHGHIVNGKMRRIDYSWSPTDMANYKMRCVDQYCHRPSMRRQTTSLRVLTFRFRAYCHLPARSEASKLRIPRRLTSACYCKAMLLTLKALTFIRMQLSYRRLWSVLSCRSAPSFLHIQRNGLPLTGLGKSSFKSGRRGNCLLS